MFTIDQIIIGSGIAIAVIVWAAVRIQSGAREKAQNAYIARLDKIEQSLPAGLSYATARTDIDQAQAEIRSAFMEEDYPYNYHPNDPHWMGLGEFPTTDSFKDN